MKDKLWLEREQEKLILDCELEALFVPKQQREPKFSEEDVVLLGIQELVEPGRLVELMLAADRWDNKQLMELELTKELQLDSDQIYLNLEKIVFNNTHLDLEHNFSEESDDQSILRPLDKSLVSTKAKSKAPNRFQENLSRDHSYLQPPLKPQATLGVHHELSLINEANNLSVGESMADRILAGFDRSEAQLRGSIYEKQDNRLHKLEGPIFREESKGQIGEPKVAKHRAQDQNKVYYTIDLLNKAL